MAFASSPRGTLAGNPNLLNPLNPLNALNP
jgi:hypothetical protein